MKQKIIWSAVLCLVLYFFLTCITLACIPNISESMTDFLSFSTFAFSAFIFWKLVNHITVTEKTKEYFELFSGKWTYKNTYFNLTKNSRKIFAEHNFHDRHGNQRPTTKCIDKICNDDFPSKIFQFQEQNLFKIVCYNNWIDYLEIEIYCYQNGRTYVLYQNRSKRPFPWEVDIDDAALDASIREHFPDAK